MARESLALNPTLTAYARGIAQETSGSIADILAPPVVVGATLGKYKAFDTRAAFMIYQTARAVGGKANRIVMEATDPTYDCRSHALEWGLDDQQKDTYGAGDPLGIERAATKSLVTTAKLSRENDVVTAINAAVSATGGVGVWGVDTNDPVKEIDAQIETIATNTGMLATDIVFGLTAWRRFVHNAKVLGRMPGINVQTMSTGRAASMITLNPQINIHIGTMVKDANEIGEAESKSQVVGSDVYIFIRSQSPSQFDPSFCKTFMGGRGGIESVRRYRDESTRSDIVAVDWTQDIQVTSSLSGKRITTADS